VITLYPTISPNNEYRIPVADGHILYVEECGNPLGTPVLFLHGGPGSGCNAGHRRYFNPDHYRIILVDQRGCGRSTPPGEIHANTTDLLIRDLETIRETIGIERWILFGGSWGATLALAYGQAHLAKVSGVVLRGAFLARPDDMAWFFGPAGAAKIFPDSYQKFLGQVPVSERGDLINAYYRRVCGDNETEALNWARSWTDWADRVATWNIALANGHDDPEPQSLLAKVRIETHYAANGYFLTDRPLLDGAQRLADIPVTLIQGRRDLVCPCEAAWLLHQAIPGSRLILLPDTGHLAIEPAMVDALVGEMDRIAKIQS
jgi:proline iminopeptidase